MVLGGGEGCVDMKFAFSVSVFASLVSQAMGCDWNVFFRWIIFFFFLVCFSKHFQYVAFLFHSPVRDESTLDERKVKPRG